MNVEFDSFSNSCFYLLRFGSMGTASSLCLLQ